MRRALLVLLLAASGALAAGNLLTNGDFAQGKPPWWGDGGWTVQDGVLSLQRGYACQDKVPVSSGAVYRVALRIRAEGTAPGAVFVQCSFRGPGVDAGWRGPAQVKLADHSEPALFVSGGTHAWRDFALNLRAPNGADQILIYLRKQDGAGQAWFDDVQVTATDQSVTTAAELRRAELAAELLPPPAADAEARMAAARRLATGTAGALRLGQARIQVASDADVVTLGAAKELGELLARITGGSYLPLSHPAAPQAGALILVGRDAALAQGIDWDALGDDGFVIRSQGQHLLLAGATPRGTLYAVYWFLDRLVGVRWLAPDCTVVPSRPGLAIGPCDERHVPRFAYREVLSDEGQRKPYKAHNLLNGDSHGPSFLPTPPEIDVFCRDWQNKGGYANFFELLPPDRYQKAHPDWYAGGQLAMMNAGMRAEMARVIVERLRAHPDYRRIWYNVHDMDWGWDMDPASAAFAQQHGGHPSAPRLDMIIDVADRVRRELPGARLAFNAYHWSFTPPTGMTVPDYVLVFPMTIHVDYSTALNAGRNEALGRDLAGWAAAARTVQVWDHITNWSGFLQPTPNLYPIARSIAWLATLPSVRGYFAEGSWDTPGAEFAALRVWLIGRLLWDPSLDANALVAEFCGGYYGPSAGPLVKQAIDLLHQRAAVAGDVLGEKANVDLKLFDRDTMLALDDLMARAEAAAAGRDDYLAHVRAARLPFDYVLSVRRAEYGLTAVDDRLKRFRDTLRAEHVRQYRQGGSLEELDALLAVERHASTPPVGLAAGEWREIGDLGVNRYESAWIVGDPAASDGGAIRMKGDSGAWAVQLKLDKLPPEGLWDVYAAVRVEAQPGHDGELAVRVGAAPPMGRFTGASVAELAGPGYHFVKAPGGPHRWSADHAQSIYVQAAAAPWLRWVWTDRFIAVRAR